jgi:hypothetical protein
VPPKYSNAPPEISKISPSLLKQRTLVAQKLEEKKTVHIVTIKRLEMNESNIVSLVWKVIYRSYL